jgi:selenocysteine lyase/cysteine desulfurase
VTGAPRPVREEPLPTSLASLRAACPILETTDYLASCSQGPLAIPVREAVDAFMRSWAALGMQWDGWVGEVERARAAFARLIGAQPEDVAVGTSVSQLVSSIVSALVNRPDGWHGRRRIVSSTLEFPGVGQAWESSRRNGWTVDRVVRGPEEPLTADDFVRMVDDAMALISVPHVVYANGSLIEPTEIARAAHEVGDSDGGALVFLDAYQSLGTMPVNAAALGVDLLAAGTLKYLMGTAGIAFLFVSPTVRERLEPTVTGWFGRVDPFAFDPTRVDYPPSASRFDLGTPPIINAYAARAGIELIVDAGIDAIHGWIRRLSALAFDVADRLGLRVLGPSTPDAKGATTAVDAGTSDRARHAEAALRDRGIVVAARGRAVRVAPHGFTTEEDLDRGLRTLHGVLEGAA